MSVYFWSLIGIGFLAALLFGVRIYNGRRYPEPARAVVTEKRRVSPRAPRPPIYRLTKRGWLSMRRFYGNRCFYCGAEGNLEKDHRVAYSAGGDHAASNIVPACASCNRRKHTHTESDFLAAIGRTEPAGQRYEDKLLALVAYVRRAAATVIETGEPRWLRTMSLFELRVAHETAQAAGVGSTSGLDASKREHVVLIPLRPRGPT